MSMAVNKFFKYLGYVGIHLLALLESYLISLVFTSPLICVTLSIMSAFMKSLPALVTGRFWLVYLVGSVPLCLIFFIMIEADAFKLFPGVAKKQFEKENNIE